MAVKLAPTLARQAADLEAATHEAWEIPTDSVVATSAAAAGRGCDAVVQELTGEAAGGADAGLGSIGPPHLRRGQGSARLSDRRKTRARTRGC